MADRADPLQNERQYPRSNDTCTADRVPRAALEAMVLAASNPAHDDGHTDCYYAGLLLAAMPHMRPVTPLDQAHAAADKRLTTLNDEWVRSHGRALPLYAPDELMAQVQGMCHVNRIHSKSGDPDRWASLLAVCLAGWCSAARAEELDVSAGGA